MPKAQPFLPNPALASNEGARTLLPNLKRRTAASGGGASGTLRGTSLVSTEALPSETRLTPGSPTSVQGGGDLKWRVTVENGGDFDESNIVVTATLSYPDTPNEPDSKQASIASLGVGKSTTVEIPGPTAPVFGEQGTLHIEIAAGLGREQHGQQRGRLPGQDHHLMEVNVWVAVAAGVPGVIALVGVVLLWISVRRTRAAQKVLLPDGATDGLIDRQAVLQRAMGRLEDGLRDLQSLVERQGEVTEQSLLTTLRFQGMVRYDAYRDMGGQQSWSIALLDGNHSGAVVTSLHARDHARVYLKELVEGTPGQRLSPEEERAVALALGRPAPPPPDPPAGEAPPERDPQPTGEIDPPPADPPGS